MYIVAIVGSPRRSGNTSYLVDRALEEAAGLGAGTEKISLSDYRLGACFAHDNCGKTNSCAYQDDGLWILKKFSEADGVILATPVYYYNMSAWMKIFIDRNWFLREHGKKCRARAVGIIVVGGGAGIEDTVSAMNRFVNGSSFNHLAVDSRRVVTGCAEDQREAKNDSKLVEEARELGRWMVKMVG